MATEAITTSAATTASTASVNLATAATVSQITPTTAVENNTGASNGNNNNSNSCSVSSNNNNSSSNNNNNNNSSDNNSYFDPTVKLEINRFSGRRLMTFCSTFKPVIGTKNCFADDATERMLSITLFYLLIVRYLYSLLIVITNN